MGYFIAAVSPFRPLPILFCYSVSDYFILFLFSSFNLHSLSLHPFVSFSFFVSMSLFPLLPFLSFSIPFVYLSLFYLFIQPCINLPSPCLFQSTHHTLTSFNITSIYPLPSLVYLSTSFISPIYPFVSLFSLSLFINIPSFHPSASFHLSCLFISLPASILHLPPPSLRRLTFCVSMCQGLGRARRSDTEPCDSPRTLSPNNR